MNSRRIIWRQLGLLFAIAAFFVTNSAALLAAFRTPSCVQLPKFKPNRSQNTPNTAIAKPAQATVPDVANPQPILFPRL